MTCVGFVTARVSLWRATLVQYAVGFSGLLAPTAVGTVALNVRFLERSGVDPAVAVSSVGLVQLIMFVGHIVLIVLFGVLAGTGAEPSFTPPQGAVDRRARRAGHRADRAVAAVGTPAAAGSGCGRSCDAWSPS